MIIFKNIFSFGLTFSAYDWVIANNGIRKVMVAAAIVQVIVCLLSVPMCKTSSQTHLCEPNGC